MMRSLGDDGWTAFAVKQPPVGALVRWRSEITGDEVTQYAERLRAEAEHLPYLWWKMTALGRMSGDAEQGG
jgi:hypothetical protein